jgi:hypothetical protein
LGSDLLYFCFGRPLPDFPDGGLCRPGAALAGLPNRFSGASAVRFRRASKDSAPKPARPFDGRFAGAAE